MKARTLAACLDDIEAAERTARLNAFLADDQRLRTDPAYDAQVNAERAERQSAVYAPMDARIAQYWRERAAMTLGAEA